jgi:putative phosphoribosyl transferase
MRFENRQDAGRRLADALGRYRDAHPVVLGVPRGGVPVASEVAARLAAPLDVVIVRKLGAPAQPELAIGALVDGDHPEEVLNPDLIELAQVPRSYVEREAARQLVEIRRREALYRPGSPPLQLRGRTVIVVDDGIATGASIRAALRAVRRAAPERLVLAVPVAPPDTVASLRSEVDDLVCLHSPEDFAAVGQFYDDFSQTTDDDVIRLLNAARRSAPSAAADAAAPGR